MTIQKLCNQKGAVRFGNCNECEKDTLDKIADDINKLKKVSGDRVYVAINDVFDVIDKYREENE